jgi:hypothetical protein
MINPVSIGVPDGASAAPAATTYSPRPAQQAPTASTPEDTVDFSKQALAGAVVDAQLSGGLNVPNS